MIKTTKAFGESTASKIIDLVENASSRKAPIVETLIRKCSSNTRPDCATVRRNGELITISPESVAIGEIVIVKPGEKIPLDGVVLDGDSMLDTRALTGESIPHFFLL